MSFGEWCEGGCSVVDVLGGGVGVGYIDVSVVVKLGIEEGVYVRIGVVNSVFW